MLDAAPQLESLHQRLLRASAALRLAEDDATSDTLSALDLRVIAAFDDRFDALGLAREARGLLRGAFEGAKDETGKAEVLALEAPLADLERALALLGRPAPSTRPPQRALRQLAPQHLERPLIAPAPSPALRELLQGSAPTGLLRDPLPALTPAGFVLRRMDELFFDLCAGLVHRRPQGAELYTFARSAEVRALRALDGLLALDLGFLGVFERQLTTFPALDPAWVLGLTVLGGCLSGRDGLAMAERLLHARIPEPDALSAHAEGLVLVAHPLVEEAMRDHLRSAAPEWRKVGAAVLAQRGTASPAELAACARDVPAVASEVLLPLSVLGFPEFRDLLDEIHAPAQAAGGALLHAYLEAALVSGHPYALEFLGSAAHRGDEHAIVLSGVCAERGPAADLYARCQTQPSVALATALGWAGDPASIALLIELLTAEDEPLTHAAAGALERITGAGLIELTPVEPPDDDGPPAAPPLAADPRDPEPKGSPDLVPLPSRDPERWRAYVKEHQPSWTAGVRTRRGGAYTPARSVTDLASFPCSLAERHLLHLELMLRTGWIFRLNLTAFVDQQAAALEELAGLTQQFRGTPGEWARPMQRQALRLASLSGPAR